MISLNFIFWMYIILFGVIGAMRGWAKELLVSFSVILALALNHLLVTYAPFIQTMVLPTPNATGGTSTPELFWVRALSVVVLVFFGYQTVNLPRLAQRAARERLQDLMLGLVMGMVNGYLIFGTLWFYLHDAAYPFAAITAPGPNAEAAVRSLMAVMPPHLLGDPWIYVAVILAFVFVLVVFI